MCFRPFALAAAVAALVCAGPGAAMEGSIQERARALGDAAEIYAQRDFAPIWTGEAAARGAALVAELRDADAHALPPSRYAPDRLAALLQSGPQDEAEIALSRAFLLYARDLSSGLLEPRDAARGVRHRAPRPSPALLLRRAAETEDLTALMAALAPSDSGYARLATTYAELRAVAERGGWGAPVSPGPTLREGDRGPRVVEIRRRLAAMGDAEDEAVLTPADPTVFDAALAQLVRAFQARHGLNTDAAVGPRTLAALNASPEKRAAQVAVNLERLRWMNRPLGDRRIMVNQADFTVRLIDGADVLFEERVIVGKPRHQTIEFSDEMEYLVLNPTWHVPRSIATEELLPQLKDDPTLLQRRNMRLSRPDGGPIPFDTASYDFTAYDAQSFPYRIRQAPNPDNALGRVKFMFPNDHAIYLHDTPTRRLFERDARTFSHGCVRVRDPLRLAEILLGFQMENPRDFIDTVLAGGRERYVNLAEHIPVHLYYSTAWIDDAGRPQFRADVYGRDAAVSAALRAHGVDAPQI